MQKSLVISLLLIPLAAAPLTWAQIYKTTDEAGNVVYTDKPAPNNSRGTSEPVQLRQLNTTPAPSAIPALTPASADEEEDEPAAIPIAKIISPKQDATIPMGPGNFSVGAQITPRLSSGQAMQLLIDGQPSGSAQQSGFWSLTNVFRGSHNLVVVVVDDKGATLSSSEPVQVHVFRPSINTARARLQ